MELSRLIISFFLLLITSVSYTQSSERVVYESQHNKSNEQAIGYLKTNQSLSRYLAYRDIPFFISKYCLGIKTLDYGAGTGFSTQFLQSQGLEVVGVDISEEMLTQAASNYPNTLFYLINHGFIPCAPELYDLVFSSFVLFELGSEDDFSTYLKEAKRILKKDGIFIAITGSEDMYSKQWLNLKNDFPENKNLKSGDLAKIYLCDADIEFTDYYWTLLDYQRFFEQVGFQLVEVHHPLGKITEPHPWKDENTSSPFVILIAKKSE